MITKKVIREMHGVKWHAPRSRHSPNELIYLIEEVGFVPLFRNEIKGFSVEKYEMYVGYYDTSEQL